jgi:hypothetical protein
MKALFESITTFFADEQWPINRIGNKEAYSLKFAGSCGEFICVAEVFEEDRAFVFYSSCPIKAPEATFGKVAELINRLNYCQLYGNFELGYLDGDIRFRTSIEMPGYDLEPLMIDRVVYNNVATMDMYLPAILDVIQHGTLPLDALSKSLT